MKKTKNKIVYDPLLVIIKYTFHKQITSSKHKHGLYFVPIGISSTTVIELRIYVRYKIIFRS